MKTILIAASLAISLTAAATPSPAVVLERDFYFSTIRAHLALEQFIPPNSIFFIGDSIIQNFEVASVANGIINFGIGGDTTVGVLHRLRQYQSIKTARTVVLESGVNDLGFGEKFDKDIPGRYGEMIKLIPERTSVYILSILPVNEKAEKTFTGYNRRILSINNALKWECLKHRNCAYINANYRFSEPGGNLKDSLRRDAVHLNEKGNRLLAISIAGSILP